MFFLDFEQAAKITASVFGILWMSMAVSAFLCDKFANAKYGNGLYQLHYEQWVLVSKIIGSLQICCATCSATWWVIYCICILN